VKKQTKFKQTEIGTILNNWEAKRLSEEIELCYGKGLTENNRISGKFPVFGSNGVVGFHNQFLVEGPGIIVGRKGSVGEIKLSKDNFWPIDTTYFVKLKKKGNIYFWYYFLLTLKLNKMNSHSAVPGLNREQVYEISKEIPAYEEQSSIAKILSDLDSKIELNQQMNKTLEAIGQAIFKHWFVDFEFPNEKGKPYKSSGGEMVDSELGKIPKGWKVGKVRDIATQSKEQTSPSDYPDDVFNHYSIEAFDIGKKPILQYGSEILSNKLVVPKESILFSKLNPRIPRLWVVIDVEKLSVGSTEFLIFKSNPLFFGYLYFLLGNLTTLSGLIQMAKGTSSSHQRISANDILNLPITIPPKENLLLFEKISLELFKKLEINIKSQISLSHIRDSLLPKLMTGKIRVIA